MTSLNLDLQEQQILCEQFNHLVEHVRDNFKFYKQFYKNIDTKPITSLRELSQYPVIDKKTIGIATLIDEVLDTNPPSYFETSGTSGNPLPVIPDLGPERGGEFADFIFDWLGLDKVSIRRAMIALPFEMNPIGIKYFAGLTKAGITAIPVGVKTLLCTPSKVLTLLKRLRPELLIGRPLETMRYALAMKMMGMDPTQSSIKKIILTGEIISKSKFDKISRLYGGASVHGVYGLTELDSGGLVSCSNYEYHLPSNPYLVVELLKDDMKTPVDQEGELGHIVLTNTRINHMPLIRYKTGDFGMMKTHCGCGNPTPVIKVLGRAADQIKVEGLKKPIFPIEIEELLFQFDDVGSDYQLIVHDGKLSLRVELGESKSEDVQAELAKQIEQRFLDEFNLKFHSIDIFNPDQLASKLGIAKSKAGTLNVLDGLSSEEIDELLAINF